MKLAEEDVLYFSLYESFSRYSLSRLTNASLI